MSELESGADRLPFQATQLGEAYEAIQALPVSIVLDNVRSLYNVGAFFRTADAACCEKLYLCGITGRPPMAAITKTALGAEETVAWQHSPLAVSIVADLRNRGYEIAAIETSRRAVDLFDWRPSFPVCLMFGHETDGLPADLLARCDTHVRIPMLGRKHSLNVSTAGGIVIYELLRKYRRMLESATIGR
jgi:23S rRNA (guanosine2251-2'-O)-methyltransferase